MRACNKLTVNLLRVRSLYVGLAGCWAALTGCQTVAAPTEGVSPVASLVARVNGYRSSVGCRTLRWHPRLAVVAQDHSEDMVRRGFFGHINPDGVSPVDRMRRGGIHWGGPAAENLAQSHGDAGQVLQLWLDSEGHRANLDDCRYGFHAIGVSEGRWTHLFFAELGN
jgi:uncharacterized protein YkwD